MIHYLYSYSYLEILDELNHLGIRYEPLFDCDITSQCHYWYDGPIWIFRLYDMTEEQEAYLYLQVQDDCIDIVDEKWFNKNYLQGRPEEEFELMSLKY